MAQFARPDADQAAGGWTTTPLWSKVDEGSPGDDTTIASGNNTSPDNADVRLSDVGDPGVSTGHVIQVAWNKDGSGGHVINAVAELWEGVPGTGTLRATLTVNNIGNTEVVSTYTLSAAESNAIGDYTNLYLRLSRQGDTGGGPSGRRALVVDFAELEVPDAATVVAVGLASEAEAGQALGHFKTVPVGQTAETDTAPAVAANRVIAVALATDTSAALASGHFKGVQTGLVVETGSAQAIAARRVHTLGLATSSATALAVTPQLGGQFVALGLSAEMDNGFGTVPRRAVALGLVGEAQAALAIISVKAIPIGQGFEADTAEPISANRDLAIGIAAATESALGLAVGKAVHAAIAIQADSPFAVTSVRARSVTIASETDSSSVVTPYVGGLIAAVGAAGESESGLPILLIKAMPLGIAGEGDSALAILDWAGGSGLATDVALRATVQSAAVISGRRTADAALSGRWMPEHTLSGEVEL